MTIALTLEPEHIEHVLLDNGLALYVLPDHRLPLVTHSIWYKVGAVHERAGQHGLAHFFEHLMFKGTQKFPDGVFNRYVAQKGGWQNAFTAFPYTYFVQSLPARCLPDLMAMEADRIHGLELTTEQIDLERNVVLEEAAGDRSNGGNLFATGMFATHFPGHRLAVPVIGSTADLEASGRDAIFDFYREHYRAANATVIVSGDVTANDAIALARQTYGQAPRLPAGDYRLPDLTEPVTRRFTLAHEQFASPFAVRRYAMRLADVSVEDSAALSLFMMAQNSTQFEHGVLRRLVLDGKLATSAIVDTNTHAIEDITLSIQPADGLGADWLEEELERSIEVMRTRLPEPRTIQAIQRMYLVALLYSREQRNDLVVSLGQHLLTGGTLADYQRSDGIVAAITTDDLARVVGRYLVDDNQVTGIAVPGGDGDSGEIAA